MAHRAARAALLAAAVAAAPAAWPQAVLVTLDAVAADEAFDALGKECYEAGMAAQMPSGSIMDCAALLTEPRAGAAPEQGPPIGSSLTHRLRFTLLERGEETSIRAEAWTEIEELGTVIEQPITAQEYLGRVEDVLLAVGERLREPAGRSAGPWAGRYASAQEWHLDAHLRAVSHCDRALPGLSAESLGRQLESIGIWPLGDDTRDRCEQLFQHLFEWGLARGDTEPTLEEYVEYRAGLPPERRPCSGRLALRASCP
jgi:hypothetical protein